MRRKQGRLREERRLTGQIAPESILGIARSVGFHRAALVDAGMLSPWARAIRGRLDAGEPVPDIEWDWLLDPSWGRTRALLVCCLSCLRTEPDDLSTPGDPHALVAPFARAHYYRAAMDMLRALAAGLESAHGIPRRSVRLFCNSRMPEKALLVASGLGAFGSNGLVIVRGLGTLFVIAGAVLPCAVTDLPPAAPAEDVCGSCRRCRDACPVGAISSPGIVDPDRCLQGLATSRVPFDGPVLDAWGARLYGCQECQAVCPHNARLGVPAPPAPGDLGPSLPLHELLGDGVDGLRGRFRGTALGMSWIAPEALLRNALVAAGNRGDGSVGDAVRRWRGSSDPAVSAAADWALPRLR